MKRLLILMVFVMLGGSAFADSTYVTNTTNAATLTDDSEMDEAAPTFKHGALTVMDIGEDLSSNNKNLWLDCPSAADSIPANSTIDSVVISLQITLAPTNDGEAVHIDIYDVSKTVVEADVTWNKYNSLSNWITGGGDGSFIQALGLKLTHLGDFLQDSVQIVNIVDGITVTDTVANQFTTKITFRIPKALAQDIYERNSAGFILKNNASTAAGIRYGFASSENSTAADRPVWTWYYRETPAYETNQANATTLIDDAYLRQESPTTQNGTTNLLILGEPSDANRRSPIIRDNRVADSIGTGFIIDSSLLILTIVNNGSMDNQFDSMFFDFYEVDQDWDEPDVSHDSAKVDILWTNAGGTKTEVQANYANITSTDAGTTFQLTTFFTSGDSIVQTGVYANAVEVIFRIPVASAQAMYDGTIFGWMFVCDTVSTMTEDMRFASTEATNESWRPIIRWYAHEPTDLNTRRRRMLSND